MGYTITAGQPEPHRGNPFPIELSGEADVPKRSRPGKVDSSEPPTKHPTKEGDLPLCTVSIKLMRGSDRFLQITSDGEMYDDPDREDRDDDYPPEDNEVEEPAKKKKKPLMTKKGSSHKKQSSLKKADAQEEEGEDNGEEEDHKEPLTPLEHSRKARYDWFMKDTEVANFFRGRLLNLGSAAVPTQAQVDELELFQERASDKSVQVPDISHVWVPLLETRMMLATEVPSRIAYPDQDAPLYKYEDLMALLPSTAGAWNTTKDKEEKEKLALVAVIPATTTFPLEEAMDLNILHNVSTLRKVTVPRSGGPKGKTDQFSF